MWPFSPTPPPERPPAFADRPMPPCGDKSVHYEWVDDPENTMGCPICSANRQQTKARSKEDDYIDRLAKAIARELKEIL